MRGECEWRNKCECGLGCAVLEVCGLEIRKKERNKVEGLKIGKERQPWRGIVIPFCSCLYFSHKRPTETFIAQRADDLTLFDFDTSSSHTRPIRADAQAGPSFPFSLLPFEGAGTVGYEESTLSAFCIMSVRYLRWQLAGEGKKDAPCTRHHVSCTFPN